MAVIYRTIFHFILDQGHLYPLGEHPGGQTLSLPNRTRVAFVTALYLKSYLDSLYADYSEPLQYRTFLRRLSWAEDPDCGELFRERLCLCLLRLP